MTRSLHRGNTALAVQAAYACTLFGVARSVCKKLTHKNMWLKVLIIILLLWLLIALLLYYSKQ